MEARNIIKAYETRPNLILRYVPLFYRTYYLILGTALIKPITKIWAEVTTLYRQLLTCTLTMQTYANVYTLTKYASFVHM